MELHDLLERLVAVLERLQIPYLITGSVAAMAYGEPRLTNDIDVVVDLDEAHAGPFAAQFPLGEYYLSDEAIRDALIRKGQFNIIHPASGLKIDVMIQKERHSNRADSSEHGSFTPQIRTKRVLPLPKMSSSRRWSIIAKGVLKSTCVILPAS